MPITRPFSMKAKIRQRGAERPAPGLEPKGRGARRMLKAWGAIRRAIFGKRVDPIAYANALQKKFGGGLPVARGKTEWMAALDRVDIENDQVGLRVRLMSEKSWKERSAFSTRSEEEMGRPVTSAPLPRRRVDVASSQDDLLLQYSFPTVISLDRNLHLFLEYAGNELRRLRDAAIPMARARE